GAWNDRLKLGREKGIPAFASANMERWFTKGFRERSPDAVAWLQQMFAATPLEGYIACGEAVRDMDHRDLLPKIKAPTLVIAGKHGSSDAARGERVHQEPHPGRAARAARRRAYFQCRAGGGLHQCGAGIPARRLKVCRERDTDDRGCTRWRRPW